MTLRKTLKAAALAASVFHSAEIDIRDLKAYLLGNDIEMRT